MGEFRPIMRSRIALASLLAAGVGGLVAAFAPLTRSCSTGPVNAATPMNVTEVCTNSSLIEHEGASLLVVLAVPVLIALVAVLARARVATGIAAALLWICCLLGLASVGTFFIPAAILMTVAAAQREPAPTPVP